MTLNSALIRAWLGLVVLFLFTGCFQNQETPTAEEKDAHYINGRNKVISLDHDGAIEEFEKALANNPKSSAAHFELGLLYEDRKKNFARAIYHFEEYLVLKPQSTYAERAREQIRVCKMELAKTEVLGPVTQQMQKDLDRLSAENIQQKKEIERLSAQLASRPVPQPPVTNAMATPNVDRPEVRSSATARGTTPGSGAASNAHKPGDVTEPAVRAKTHTVKSGETFAGIAKQHNVKLASLQSANPGIDPRRVRVGQVLQLP
ncbi:MAG: LysM peptidoglycan-binding protein [Verrucomicrobiales bacterium]|nr:LysM peptidoglycan-binding protein [Verrucomicrobiales bacterium]